MSSNSSPYSNAFERLGMIDILIQSINASYRIDALPQENEKDIIISVEGDKERRTNTIGQLLNIIVDRSNVDESTRLFHSEDMNFNSDLFVDVFDLDETIFNDYMVKVDVGMMKRMRTQNVVSDLLSELFYYTVSRQQVSQYVPYIQPKDPNSLTNSLNDLCFVGAELVRNIVRRYELDYDPNDAFVSMVGVISVALVAHYYDKKQLYKVVRESIYPTQLILSTLRGEIRSPPRSPKRSPPRSPKRSPPRSPKRSPPRSPVRMDVPERIEPCLRGKKWESIPFRQKPIVKQVLINSIGRHNGEVNRLNQLKVQSLSEILHDACLPKSGRKNDLVQRIENISSIHIQPSSTQEQILSVLGVDSANDLSRSTVVKLRQALKMLNMQVGGKKQDLINRVQSAL